jgi:hypothetical protein
MNMEFERFDDIKLREELKWMMNNWGYYIILVRASSMLCSCSSKEGQQASSFCTKCLGIGRRIKLEKRKVVGLPSSQVISRPNSTQQGNIGEIYSDAKKFYCDFFVHPNVGSFIYEVSWKDNNIINIHGVYKIEHADPLRMDDGKIEYYAIHTHREVMNIDFKEKVLKELYRGK